MFCANTLTATVTTHQQTYSGRWQCRWQQLCTLLAMLSL